MIEMDKRIKNLDFSTILTLGGQVAYQPGQIVSKTLAQNKAVSITLFAFEKDEEISSHESDGDALVTILDGTSEVTIDGENYVLNEGESIVMPAKRPHAVYAKERFKMSLTVVFPQE